MASVLVETKESMVHWLVCPCNQLKEGGTTDYEMLRRFKYLVTHNDAIKQLVVYNAVALARTTNGGLDNLSGDNVLLPSLSFLAPGTDDTYNRSFKMTKTGHCLDGWVFPKAF
jgi:hypothetical protein